MQSDTMSTSVWTRVSTEMREALEDFARLVREVFVQEAKALTIFGKVVTGGFDARSETARSVLVTDRVNLSTLRRLAGNGARLGKSGIGAPLVVTPKYLRDSLDSFPLELIEIQQQGVTVFGDDHFAELAFEEAHVRLQCERELKRALIALRQGLLATAGLERHVPALQREAANQLLRTLRGMLWLKGRREFVEQAGVLEAIESIASRKVSGLRAAFDSTVASGWPDFDNLYADVESLMEMVEGW